MRTAFPLIAALLPSLAFGQFANMRTESNGDTVTMTFASPISVPAVTGRPYSAEETLENVQTLADGTHIRQPVVSRKMWRDMEGRTRTERRMFAGLAGSTSGFVMIEVRDPVAGIGYILDDQNKIAHKLTIASGATRPRAPTMSTGPTSSTTTENLGQQNIEGVIATGTRSTHTIPVGQMGNDRPLVTVNETWYSQDLGLYVLVKSSDPRSGDRTTKLTNISRTTPEAALFAPPPGYTVVEETDSFSMTVKRQ